MLPDELPEYELSREALVERDRIVRRTGRLLTVAAVYLAADHQSSSQKVVQVDREDVLKAAKALFVPKGKYRIPWLNEFVESLALQSCFLSQRYCQMLCLRL